MIQAKIVMDSGAVFYLGSEHGSYFDIDPLTSMSVTINTQTGFQTVGAAVSDISMVGTSRTVSGSFISASARTLARGLCATLLPAAKGVFYLGSETRFEFYVEKSPELTFRSHDFIDFDFMVYSESPYIQSENYVVGTTCEYISMFEFPQSLDTHTFSQMSPAAVNLINDGQVESDFSVEFTALQDCSNFGIINVDTLEKMELDTTLEKGDKVAVEWVDGILTVRKNGTENILAALTEESDLFKMHPGGNVIKSYCAEDPLGQTGYVQARIKFSATYSSFVEV